MKSIAAARLSAIAVSRRVGQAAVFVASNPANGDVAGTIAATAPRTSAASAHIELPASAGAPGGTALEETARLVMTAVGVTVRGGQCGTRAIAVGATVPPVRGVSEVAVLASSVDGPPTDGRTRSVAPGRRAIGKTPSATPSHGVQAAVD